MSNEPFLMEIAIEPKSKRDQERMGVALNQLAQEGASFDLSVDHESGQTIIKGRDEIHLEIIVSRLKCEFGIEANVGALQVAYRETITQVKEHDYTHKKQAGGSGEFARVKIRFEPLPVGSGFEFENALAGGEIPKEYIPGVENGVKRAKECGVVAGFPVIDFKATLIDAAYHRVDSNIMVFEIASRACFRAAIPQAGPKLLQPMMKVEVVTPEGYLGDVIGDLNGRRGQVMGMEASGKAQIVMAIVPLANMFGYMNDLLKMTQGHAEYEMQFDHYEQVPLLAPHCGGGNFPGAKALREGARLA